MNLNVTNMLTEQEIQSLINQTTHEISLYDTDDEFDTKCKRELTQLLEKLQSLLDPTQLEQPNTIGHFLRSLLLQQRIDRYRTLQQVTNVPFMIINNELNAIHRCLHPKPVQHWDKYKNLTLINHEERSGRKGKKYLILYTNNLIVYLFQSRFGSFLTDNQTKKEIKEE
jgi:hypothetical protein